MKLSERQKSMLAFIAEFVEGNNYPPTIREIGTACGISSTSVVKYNLTKLERGKLIKRDKEVSRGLSLDWGRLQEAGLAVNMIGAPNTDRGVRSDGSSFNFFQVPVLGNIAAGQPIQVETADHFSADEWLDLNEVALPQSGRAICSARAGRFHDRRQRPRWRYCHPPASGAGRKR